MDVTNLIESGLLHQDWKNKYPLSLRYQLYTNRNDLKHRILSLYNKYNVDFAGSSIADQTLNIWNINRAKIADTEIEPIGRKLEEKARGEMKHHLIDLSSNKVNDITHILVLSYIILYYLSDQNKNMPDRKCRRWQNIYHDKINYDNPNVSSFDKDNFNKDWKFDINTHDVINYWMHAVDRCSWINMDSKDNKIEIRMRGDYRTTSWHLQCEWSDKFQGRKYQDLKDALEYDEFENGEIYKDTKKTEINGIANDIEKMLLLPDFIEFERWYYVDVRSHCGCGCWGMEHKYRICIGEIKGKDENKFVLWKNKYYQEKWNKEDPMCCCD